MQRIESLWLKIIGVLLILLGLTIFISPRITYNTKETLVHTGSLDVTTKTPKTIFIPRAAGVIVVAIGAIAVVVAVKKAQ